MKAINCYFSNTFNYHSNLISQIHKPRAKNLMIQEKIAAVAWSFFFFITTLGVAHLITYSIEKARVKKETANTHEKNRRFDEVKRATEQIAANILIQPSRNAKEKRKNLGSTIQEKFITGGYNQPFPERDEIIVQHPTRNEKVKWGTLYRAEKVLVNNKHALKHSKLSGLNELLVDYYVAPPGHGTPYLEMDPRRIHGNDHSARVSIYFAVFANLYAKYFPDYQMTGDELILGQLIAAGHDMGREADGTDLFDEQSAFKTAEILRSMGYRENEAKLAIEAINGKDAQLSPNKSLIARCLQNADSADFPRTLAVKKSFGMRLSAKQSTQEFEASKEYLDIYQDAIDQIDDEDRKNLFFFELESIRHEMAEFTYLTNSRQMRANMSQEGKNIYDEMIKFITPSQFPLLYHTLKSTGVIEDPQSFEEKQWRGVVENQQLMLQEFGPPAFKDEDDLASSINRITPPESLTLDEQDKHLALFKKLEKAYRRSWEALKEFDRVIEREEAFQVKLLAFGRLSPQQKDARRALLNDQYSDLKLIVPDSDEEDSAIADFAHSIIKNEIYKNDPKKLLKAAREIVSNYKKIKSYDLKDPRQLTTAALMYQKAAKLYRQEGNQELSNACLTESGKNIPLTKYDPQFNFMRLFPLNHNGADHTPFQLLRGAKHLRNHRLRVSRAFIPDSNKTILELSFELTSRKREEIEEILVRKGANIVPATFHQKANGAIVKGGLKSTIGKDYLFTFANGIEIRVGATKKYKNQYDLVQIKVPSDTSLQDAHQALSELGLPMALLPPRKEDLASNALGRAVHILEPKACFKRFPKPSPEEIYEKLEEGQKEGVDRYTQGALLKPFGGRAIEQVFPAAVEDVKKEGGQTLAHFVWGGTIEKIGALVGTILNSGSLSASERLSRGILGRGYVPKLNYQTGSGNQVFARTVTSHLMNKSQSFAEFPLNSEVLMLIDIQAYERTPYLFPEDRGGLRNPHYCQQIPWYSPQQGITFRFDGRIPAYDGKQALKDRLSPKELCRQIDQSGTFCNETVFNHSFDPSYFIGLVVESEYHRQKIIQSLHGQGIYDINGLKLKEAVVVSTQGMNSDKVRNLINSQKLCRAVDQRGKGS